jgi:hypothetical protein
MKEKSDRSFGGGNAKRQKSGISPKIAPSAATHSRQRQGGQANLVKKTRNSVIPRSNQQRFRSGRGTA